MEPRLTFEGVWKRFRRGQVHDSLREMIPALARRLSGRKRSGPEERDFWALRDLSFDVRPGEVLGIIGGNGAGKSTSLKILNQLMEPTEGHVVAEGKVGSLIEVSAGFHQDLTGRQNVFLQGAIMGMRKAEVRRKFDQIVEFAGVADFIDTPVKRYSSGMNARLGFSIAAHLEPDVLIIDEVLSVGDFEFQQRAFGKIKGLATSGVPVVLVSHQLDRIAELCTKAILLEKGSVKASGTAAYCIEQYMHPPGAEENARRDEQGFRFCDVRSLNGLTVLSGDHLRIEIDGESRAESYPRSWQLACYVTHAVSGQAMHAVFSTQRNVPIPEARKFVHRVDLQMNVPPGPYIVGVVIHDTSAHRPVLVGPTVSVEVFEKNKFTGSAQLNSQWTIVTEDKLDDSRGHDIPTRRDDHTVLTR